MYGQFDHVLRMFEPITLKECFLYHDFVYLVFSNTNDTCAIASFLSLDYQTLLLLLIDFVAKDRIQNNIA